MRVDERTDGPAVRIRSMSVERGGREVLHDVDLEVPAGRVTGIVGPSGGGKSTLMRAIVGVQQRVSGIVEVLGRPAGEASRSGQVGYMAQDAAVYDDLTIRENLAYVAKLLDVSDDDVAAIKHRVRLDDSLQQRVGDLSGGQRARVSLAMALLGAPPLLVLDEPTVGLDPVLRRELWGGFADLAAAGRTLLVSSHVMDEAQRCDWLVLLRDGRILSNSSRSELLERTGSATVEEAFLALIDEEEAR
jgi:ABC-2 type transport system ATP-binding protein